MVLKQICNSFFQFKSNIIGSYNAKKYWKERHKKYGFNLKGTGNKNLTDEENALQYQEAQKTFLDICKKNKIDFSKISVLDIGCGSGYYTKIFWEKGCVNYTGVDITNVLFIKLKKQYLCYKFKKLDITKEKLENCYDLIIMIDVSQHITTDKKFKFAMNNVKNSLKKDGLFIVTSWLNKTVKNSFYEKSRSIKSYKECFKSKKFSKPVKFRDKYIFTIRY
jgi:SAM-dependent methyltransferase